MGRKKSGENGFTLVEILIVIIIIGVLAQMILMAAGSITAKAEAAKLAADIKIIKAAAIMYKADNPGGTLLTGGKDSDKAGKLMNLYGDGKYSDEIPGFSIWGGYNPGAGTPVQKKNGIWLIYNLNTGMADTSMRESVRKEFIKLAKNGAPFLASRTDEDKNLKPYSGGESVFVFLCTRSN